MFALYMFWVAGLVDNFVGCTVREFRDPCGHKFVDIKRNRSNRDRLVTVHERCENPPGVRTGHSRIYVWLANLQSDIQKLFLELVVQPRARSEATDEERKLLPDH